MGRVLRSRFSLLVVGLFTMFTLAAVACGSDRPASGPSPTPSGGTATPEPTPTTVPTPTPVSHEVLQQRLDAARANWAANGPAAYNYDIAWICFCAYGGNVTRLSISDGVVVSAIDPETGNSVGEDQSGPQMTVDELFEWLQAALDTDSGNVLGMTFDDVTGHPVTASIDRVVAAIDDEVAFNISNFGQKLIDLDELQQEVNAATLRWFDSGYESYEFVFRWSCFCPVNANTPVRIRVEAGQIVSVTDAVTGEPVEEVSGLEYRDVSGLFGWISENLGRAPDFAALKFDPVTGYPLSAYFNPVILATDEEIVFHIDELSPINTHVELQAELDEARTLWNASAPSAYSYTFNWQCFCMQDFTAQVFVTVQDGKVVSVARVEDIKPVTPYRLEDFETVSGLFDRLQDAIDSGAASIRAKFDTVSGLPTEVFIDYQSIMADEELGWNAGPVMSPVTS